MRNTARLLVAAIMLVAAFVASAQTEADRPDVLIIGDSISIGYTPHVQSMMANEANVKRIPGNGQHTGTGLLKIDEWLGDTEWDVIHFNWGLHDLAYRVHFADGRSERDKVNGVLTHDLEQYEANLRRLVERLKETGATLVWATTTPVPDGEPGRKVGDDWRYNEVALRIMQEHHVMINDLHAFILPRQAKYATRPGDVHFTQDGSIMLATEVTHHIRGALAKRANRPNVIVIISDDAGYADFSFQGAADVPTPNLDALASSGIRCTQGYVTASVCSPSRAGLLTGRYQQRFGHEMNIPPAMSEVNGLPVEQYTIADGMRAAGYRTIALGKWHLGYAPHFHPLKRGFSDFFGFLQGARSYWPIEGTRLNRLLRDHDPIVETAAYMTDELGKQAAAYIEAHRDRPFFMYLSFNAVHTPMHVPEDVLASVPSGEKEKRRKLIAMTMSMDAAIGEVLSTLHDTGLTENTIVFFINDNGGATNNASSNGYLRGTKGTPFEGGIRVPYLVSWPARFSAGQFYENPVSTFDIMPTAFDAVGFNHAALPEPLDGTSLLPYLNGESADRPHDTLYWKRGHDRAIRDGDWKLVKREETNWMLFNLADDPGERKDIAADYPDVKVRLRAMYQNWLASMVEAKWRRSP